MCQGDAAPKQRTEGSLKEAGKLFLKHTTFHGVRHVFLSGSYPRRVAWLLAFLTALALLFTWSSNRVRYLLSSPVYTKAHMVYAKRLVFPAVTICNQNILLPRRMKKPDIFNAGRWLGLFGKNWQVSPAVREALISHVDGTNNEPPWSPFYRILDFNHFLPPPRDSQPSMRQLLDRLGHQLEEMLLYCRFQGQMCGPRNFSTVSLCTFTCTITHDARIFCSGIVMIIEMTISLLHFFNYKLLFVCHCHTTAVCKCVICAPYTFERFLSNLMRTLKVCAFIC